MDVDALGFTYLGEAPVETTRSEPRASTNVESSSQAPTLPLNMRLCISKPLFNHYAFVPHEFLTTILKRLGNLER